MPDYSFDGKLQLFPYDTRYRPIAPPTAGIFDEPTIGVCINVQWAAHLDGVLERLLWPDAWAGSEGLKIWAVGEVTKLIVSLIQRNPCGGGDCMSECCDDILERLEAIEEAIKKGEEPTPDEVKTDVDAVYTSYTDYLEDTDAIYNDDITNVHPDMAYGDANDELRDQALCFMSHRFVNICCDWVAQNIRLKQANQQTALNLASIIGGAADLLGRLFAETAFGPMFENIDMMLELEVAALTTWVTSVSVEQLAIFEDQEARDDVACGWYDGMKGQTPTASLFLSALAAANLTGNADVIRDKLAEALVPVDVERSPDPEHVFFIWADLWQEAYAGVQAGIVPECECDDEEPPDDDWITVNWKVDGQSGWLAFSNFAEFVPGEGWKVGAGSASQLALQKELSQNIKTVELTFNEARPAGVDNIVGPYGGLGPYVHNYETTEVITWDLMNVANGLFLNPYTAATWPTTVRLEKMRYKVV